MRFTEQGQAHEAEFCSYNSRNFRTDLKRRLKILAAATGKSLEELVNIACEEGLRVLEGRKDV